LDRRTANHQNQITKLKFTAQEDAAPPYSEDELFHILELAGTLNGTSEDYERVPATFGLLCELMNESGLRISDAIDFNPAKCTPLNGTAWRYSYYPHKHNRTHELKENFTYLPTSLKQAIDACVWMSATQPFTPQPKIKRARQMFEIAMAR